MMPSRQMANTKKRACTRKVYMNKDQALAAARCMWRNERYVRAYSCPFCSGWHLTKHHRKRMDVLFEKIGEQLRGTA